MFFLKCRAKDLVKFLNLYKKNFPEAEVCIKVNYPEKGVYKHIESFHIDLHKFTKDDWRFIIEFSLDEQKKDIKTIVKKEKKRR